MKSTLVLRLAIVLLPVACHHSDREADRLREITVLYTNDEHGWMEGMAPGQGAANLYQLWQEQEGFSEDGPFLVLSGGDNFTGPAISTWVQGESMVEVMNAMQYDASAVGNHEFDFGLEALSQRAKEAHYPYLGANIRWHDNGRIPEEIGILPYTVGEVDGLMVGIIGLTTTSTPRISNPEHVRDLEFTAYEPAVRRTLNELGATDLRFIISHVCLEELEPLVSIISDLDIALAGAGHCNELVAKTIGDTVVLGGGHHFSAYARATFRYDPNTRRIADMSFGTRRNAGATEDGSVADIVRKWTNTASDALKEVLAYSELGLARGEGLEQLIINSWLEAYPEADIAMTNMGGIRADLPAGDITLSDVVNILPFDNTIITVDVNGRTITAALERGGRSVTAGLERNSTGWILKHSGEPLQPDQYYTLLLNSFMYAGGDDFDLIQASAPDALDTGLNYRQPFAEWLRERFSSPDNPLDFTDF